MEVREQRHQHRVTQSDIIKEYLGMFLAFVLFLGAIWAGYDLLMNDKDLTGLVAFLTPLAGLGAILIFRRRGGRDHASS